MSEPISELKGEINLAFSEFFLSWIFRSKSTIRPL